MTSLPLSKNQAISLSAQAAAKLKELKLEEKGNPWGLRFADRQGECGAGYEHIIQFTSFPLPQDEIFYSHEIPIYVPKESIQRLQGSRIEYHPHEHASAQPESLETQGFIILNPNIKAPCPCGCNKGFDC